MDLCAGNIKHCAQLGGTNYYLSDSSFYDSESDFLCNRLGI